jgi:hypothetical protein
LDELLAIFYFESQGFDGERHRRRDSKTNNAQLMDAEEGCYLQNRVFSTVGRTADMLTIHTLSARQFTNSSVRAGMSVAILDAAINAERRDRQTEQDQMMVREFRQNLFFIGQNIAFRDDVMGGKTD